jgi:hypothetical protein
MTTYAPNWTPRYRARYQAAGVTHTVQVRGLRTTDDANIATFGAHLFDFFAPLAPVMADDFAWIDASYALTDSDLFAPTTTPAGITGDVPVANFEPKEKVIAIAFSGRALGSRARLYVYGGLWNETTLPGVDDNAVITTSEWVNLSTSIAVANNFFCAGSGALATWYNQVTVKENDHLLKLVRRGTIS